MTPNASPPSPLLASDPSDRASAVILPIGLFVSVIAFLGLFFGGCFHRPIAKAKPAPVLPEPVAVAASLPSVAPRSPTPTPAAPLFAARQGTQNPERVRDTVGETLAGKPVPDQPPFARDMIAARLGAERAERIGELEQREERKKEVGILVTTAARRELLRAAARQGLTVVDEQPLRVKFEPDLRSGT